MSPELDKKLVEEHPMLFADRHANMRTTAMCWGFDVGDGWYDLIKEAADKIEPIVTKLKVSDPEGWGFGYYRASQVKEKFGTLRFYMSGSNDEIEKIIDEAERKSAITCEECGKPGRTRGGSWVLTRCDSCAQKRVAAGHTVEDFDD